MVSIFFLDVSHALFADQRGLAIRTVHLLEVTANTLLELLYAPAHLAVSKCSIAIVYRFELAAINGYE
jgi:hypothetical protein